MKKLTPRYKKWLVYRAQQRKNRTLKGPSPVRTRHRKIVTAWFGDRVEKVLAIGTPTIPPSVICFDQNPEDSMNFLALLRDRFSNSTRGAAMQSLVWTRKSRRPNGLNRIGGYSDFAKINHISTAAALVLAAEYDRAGTLINSVPPTINLDQWPDAVFKKLYEIGFFEIVGLTERVAERYSTDGNIRTMRIQTGSNASELEVASEAILELSQFILDEDALTDEVALALNNALSEAMINVARHAYPDDHTFEYSPIGRWWVTASANCESRVLQVVILDQGASIPVTFPRKEWAQVVKDFVRNSLNTNPEFEFQNDGVYIEGAMKPGKSQTNQIFRGHGLPEMKDLIDICGSGSIKIYSRGGECRYNPSDGLTHNSRPITIGGTLIEWTLILPESANHE